MGIIKGIGKVLGTTVLGATGVASTVLKEMFDTAGVEVGSEIFGAAKDASFNGIRNIWGAEPPAEEEYADERDARIAATKEEIRKLKVKAYKSKDYANKATDENVRDNFRSRYEGLMEEANYLEAHMYDPDDE